MASPSSVVSLFTGALLVLASGCGGSVETTATGGSGSGEDDCQSEGYDCVDACGNFVSGHCKNGDYVCPPIDPQGCPWGSGGGGSGGGTSSPPLPARWSAGYGEPDDYQGGHAIAAGPGGEAVVAFAFGGSIDLGGGVLVNVAPDVMYDMDIALASFDAEGKHLWSKAFGAPGKQWPTAVAVDPAGNILVAGTFTGELDFGTGPLSGSMFVAKLDPAGNPLWARGYPGDYTISLALGPSGDVLAALRCPGGTDLGGGPLPGEGKGDICLVALDPEGTHVWSRLLGGPEYDTPIDIAVGPGGEIVVAGVFQDTLLLPDPLVSQGFFDAFVARLGPDGTPLWGRSLGGQEKDGAASVVWSPDGPVVTGWFTGEVDLGAGPVGSPGADSGFVLWLDPDGGHRASLPFSGLTTKLVGDEEWRLALDPSGGVVLAGQFVADLEIGGWGAPSAGEEDVALVRLTSEGEVAWAYRYGADNAELAGGVAVAPSGDILLTGTYYFSTPDFGNGPLQYGGNGDAYLASFPPDPPAP